MKLNLKELIYRIGKIREERLYRRLLRRMIVIADSSVLLDMGELGRLKQFDHVLIPKAVWDHLDKIAGHRGKHVKQIIQTQIKIGKPWDIIHSRGTGKVPVLAQIKLKDLGEETQKELQRKVQMDVDYITLEDRDVLGAVEARKLRVIAAAQVVQESKKRREKVVLATRDINMLAVAEDEIVGLPTISKLTKLHIIEAGRR